jgi:transcriptional regulator with XRE-family HTH domain
MKFNYSKLLGRMKEYGFTQEKLAEAVGISKYTLNAKLNNHFSFSQDEIIAICKVLHIPARNIGNYFYAI